MKQLGLRCRLCWTLAKLARVFLRRSLGFRMKTGKCCAKARFRSTRLKLSFSSALE